MPSVGTHAKSGHFVGGWNQLWLVLTSSQQLRVRKIIDRFVILLTMLNRCGLLRIVSVPFLVHQEVVMLRNTSLPRLRIVIITLVSVCVLVLGVGARRKSGNRPAKQDKTAQIESINPQVQNKTRSFELIQARRNRSIDAAGPELSLRNGYDKNITAFAVSVNGLLVSPDFVYSENEDWRSIAPGAVYTSGFGYVVRSVNPAFPVAAPKDFDINVLAVVFDDGSSDGDEKAAAGILYARLKSKRILTRIVDLLDGDLNSRAMDYTLFDELKSRISSLSNDPADASDINDVLRWLGQSDHGLSPSERTVGVKQTCENLLARL